MHIYDLKIIDSKLNLKIELQNINRIFEFVGIKNN